MDDVDACVRRDGRPRVLDRRTERTEPAPRTISVLAVASGRVVAVRLRVSSECPLAKLRLDDQRSVAASRVDAPQRDAAMRRGRNEALRSNSATWARSLAQMPPKRVRSGSAPMQD